MINYYSRFGGDPLKNFSKNSKFSWVKVVDPSEEEIEKLVGDFNLDKDSIIDGLDIYESPRIDNFAGKTYVFLRVPESGYDQYTVTLLLILDGSKIFSVSKKDLDLFSKLDRKKSFSLNSPVKSLLGILSYISHLYNQNVRKIIKDTKREKRNLSRLKNKDLLDLVSREDKLNEFLYSFVPLIGLEKQIIKMKNIKLTKKEEEFLEDLIVDLDQAYTNCRTTLKTISNMRAYYSGAMSNNINKVITLLTVFTIFLTVPTLISSIYGMNIHLPYQESPRLLYFLSGIVLVVYSGLIYYLRRLGFFEF